MAKLIPIKDYKGTITGKRQPTKDEIKQYGTNTQKQRIVNYSPQDGNVKIIVRYETWDKIQRAWKQTLIPVKNAAGYYQKDNTGKIILKPIDRVFSFNSLQAAIDYIPAYMKKKGAKPASKSGKEYTISETGYWKNNSFIPYDNHDWNTKQMSFFSQWILSGKYFMRITFESHNPMQYMPQNYDYHNRQPEEINGQGTKKYTLPGKTNTRVEYNFRTYTMGDPQDTSEQTRKTRKYEKWKIDQEHEQYAQQHYKMTLDEYRNRDNKFDYIN